MCIDRDQGQTTPGDKILMSTETSCHLDHLLQVLKKKQCLCMILYSFFFFFFFFFFHDFIHIYDPRAGADNPLGTKF